MKFGGPMQQDIAKVVQRSMSKPEVKWQYGGCLFLEREFVISLTSRAAEISPLIEFQVVLHVFTEKLSKPCRACPTKMTLLCSTVTFWRCGALHT